MAELLIAAIPSMIAGAAVRGGVSAYKKGKAKRKEKKEAKLKEEQENARKVFLAEAVIEQFKNKRANSRESPQPSEWPEYYSESSEECSVYVCDDDTSVPIVCNVPLE